MVNIENLSGKELWQVILQKLNENRSPYANLDVTYQFELKGEKETVTYQLAFKNGQVEWAEGTDQHADCVLEMKEADFKRFLAGKLKGTAAFMTGKLKVKGNIGLALKLESLVKQYTF